MQYITVNKKKIITQKRLVCELVVIPRCDNSNTAANRLDSKNRAKGEPREITTKICVGTI
jgi:hypothetical protein